MNRTRLILLAAVFAIAIAGYLTRGFGLIAAGDDAPGLEMYGNVDVREVEMAFRVPGRIADVLVDEGDRVAPGDLLAVIDAAPVEDRVRQAEADIAVAEANLARLVNGSRSQDVAAARARVDAANVRLADARADAARREPLSQNGAISRSQWEDTQSAVRAAEAQLREAEAALSLQRDGARPEDIAAARAQLARAEAARASIGTDLGDTRLAAASDGLVLTRAVEPGSLVQPGETVLTIAIDRPLRVRAYIAEPDLSRIAPGMAVEVRADGNPRVYAGRIASISPRAEFTPRTVETEDLRTDLVYRLRIIVDEADDGLRQGQPVSVRVPQARPAADD